MTHRKPIAFLATALTGAALVAPAAHAQPIDSQVASATGTPAGVNAGLGPVNPNPSVPAHPAPPVAANGGSSGFDWGDAGIGAAATLSILGLGAGAATLSRRSRSSRPAVS